jgi:hypothetical protein
MGQCNSVKANDEFEIYRRKFLLTEKVCKSLTKQIDKKDNVNDVASIKSKYDMSKKLPEHIADLQTTYNMMDEVYVKQEAQLRPHEKMVKQNLLKECKVLMDKYQVSSNELVYN